MTATSTIRTLRFASPTRHGGAAAWFLAIAVWTVAGTVGNVQAAPLVAPQHGCVRLPSVGAISNAGSVDCVTPNCNTLFAPPEPIATSHFQPIITRFGIVPPPLQCVGDPSEHHEPVVGCGSRLTPCDDRDFSNDPNYDCVPFEISQELGIYGNKFFVPAQRPLIEWGIPFYENGPMPRSSEIFGPTNVATPKFYVFGDYRMGFAQSQNVARESTELAHRLNLELDLWLTGTERIHAFIGPFQEGADFMRIDNGNFIRNLSWFDDDFSTLFFEGDLGQMLGGMEHTLAPFDMPVTAGLIPLLFQNGTWMLDAIWGAAVTVPAQNSPVLDWSNFDVTFFAGLDQVSSGAFPGENHAASLYGATTFIESQGGYAEVGYAFVEDRHGIGRSYHNLGVSYTRRYLNRVSNSVRVIVNAGQNGPRAQRTADGVLLLVENSLISKNPYNVIPYLNFFAGFGSPQPVARAGVFGGVLFNTGILFQADGLTGYPTLDPTGNNTAGAALGLDLLAPNFDQQLIVEAAILRAYGDAATRSAAGNQMGIGMRYQLPLSNAHLIRADAMVGLLDNSRDISGARIEYRWKF